MIGMDTKTDSPKLCECGCGQPAPVAPFAIKSKGMLKGQPYRFIHGHQSRGVPSTLKGKSRFPVSVEDRFWSKIDKNGPIHPILKTPCWLWKGTVAVNGYGDLSVEGKRIGTHRLSYQIHYGGIESKLHVLHKCDNRICCNPEHLFTGTQADNVKDMGHKGRWRNQHASGSAYG